MFTRAAVVMGVASCGKTAVGARLALALGVPFIEGDTLHPPANIVKMTSGTPLDDEDRWPWLTQIGRALGGNTGCVASCSALKQSYRQHIVRYAGRPVSFVFLYGSSELLAQRIAQRDGHFMPASLLQSQLGTLEPPGPNEKALWLHVADPVSVLVERARMWLLNGDCHG